MPRSRVARLALPWLGRLWTQEPADRLGIELGLVVEVTIEAAVRQAGIFHDFVDRYLGVTLLVEQTARAFENSLPRLRVMLHRIRHKVLLSDECLWAQE